jgi:hypothetical protein
MREGGGAGIYNGGVDGMAIKAIESIRAETSKQTVYGG